MVVALDYMKRLSVEPTSKKTSIADITFDDENPSRGVDFLNALVHCYNDQANIDKNEIALKTEQFINERLEKIDKELGTTESSLESYKRRNAVTRIEADAAQSLHSRPNTRPVWLKSTRSCNCLTICNNMWTTLITAIN